MSDFKLTPAREKELEKIAKELPDAEFKKRYGKDWKSIKIATAMNILKKKKGFKEETKMKFKDLREKMSGSKLTGMEISVWYRKNKDVAKAVRKDKNLKKAVEIALDHGGAMNYAIKKIEKIKRGLADNPHVAKALSFANFGESISEGTWAIPDSYEKMYDIQFKHLSKKVPGTKSNAKKYANDLYSLFGDDSFFDDLYEIEEKPDPKIDLRTILIKHLNEWNVRIIKSGSAYVITHAPKSWWEKEGTNETAKKRKSGNIRPTGLGSPVKGKLMAESLEEGVKKADSLDKAERILNYKLKELQYKAELRRFNEYEEDKVKQYRMEANNAPLAKRAEKRFKGIDKRTAQRIANVVKPGRVIQSKLYVELGDLWDKGDKKGFEKHLKKLEKK